MSGESMTNPRVSLRYVWELRLPERTELWVSAQVAQASMTLPLLNRRSGKGRDPFTSIDRWEQDSYTHYTLYATRAGAEAPERTGIVLVRKQVRA